MPKKLEVTGLANETDFENDSGEVKYLLVFNKGALRVPVTAEVAQEVLEFMYGKPNGHTEQQVSDASEDPMAYDQDEPSVSSDEDGIEQV